MIVNPPDARSRRAIRDSPAPRPFSSSGDSAIGFLLNPGDQPTARGAKREFSQLCRINPLGVDEPLPGFEHTPSSLGEMCIQPHAVIGDAVSKCPCRGARLDGDPC